MALSASPANVSPAAAALLPDLNATRSILAQFDNLIEWHDVTELFSQATREFAVGQLVKLPSFGLGEAMSAIELMDPKMDAGMVLPGVDSVTVDDVFQKELIKLDNYTSPELIALMDDLMIVEMRYLVGDMLSQSIFMWAQLHRPYAIRHAVLQAFCISVLKAVDLTRSRVVSSGIPEEEDMFFEGSSVPRLDMITNDEVMSLFESVEQNLASLDDTEESLAIRARLSMRKEWLRLLILFDDQQKNDDGHWQKALDTLSELKRLIIIMKKTISLGKEGVSDGLYPSLTRSMGVHAPPRPSGTFTRIQAIDYFETVLGQLEALCNASKATSIVEITRLVDNITSSKPPPCVFVRSRLRMTLFVERERDDPLLWNRLSLYKVVLPDELTRFSHAPFCVPAALPESFIPAEKRKTMSTNELQFLPKMPEIVAVAVDAFMPTLAKNIVELFHVRLKNRARYRRRLRKTIEQWELLQQMAEETDASIQDAIKSAIPVDSTPPPLYPCHFTAFVYVHKLQMMADYLLLGFELDIYRPHEYIMIYWYLDFILGVDVAHRQSITRHVISDVEFRAQAIKMARPKTAKAKAALDEAAQPFAGPHTTADLVFVALKHCVVRGILRLLCGLHLDGVLVFPQTLFKSEQMIFKHRFQAFSMLATPLILTYEQFQAAMDFTGRESSELYKASHESLTQAKVALERFNKMTKEETNSLHSETILKQEVSAYARVCIANLLFLTQHLKSPVEKVKFDFKFHACLPIVQADVSASPSSASSSSSRSPPLQGQITPATTNASS